MSPQHHIIKKQIIELHLPDAKDAFKLQNKVSRIFREALVPVMDAWLSEFSDPDLIHHIDALEIDLGRVELDGADTSIADKFARALKQQLTLHLQPLVASPCPPPPLRVTDREGAQMDLIIHFLKTGTLPWWAGTLSPGDLKEAMEQFITRTPAAAIRFLLDNKANAERVRRLIYQVPDDLLFEFTKRFFPDDTGFLSALADDVTEILGNMTARPIRSCEQSRTLIRRSIFSALVSTINGIWPTGRFSVSVLVELAAALDMPNNDAVEEINRAIRGALKSGYQFKTAIAQASPGQDDDFDALAFQSKSVVKMAPFIQPTDLTRRLQSPSSDAVQGGDRIIYPEQQRPPPNAPLSALRGKVRSQLGQPLSAETRWKRKDPENVIKSGPRHRHPVHPVEDDAFNQSEEMFLHNAGLVILWPFLARFFKRIGLVKESAFVDSRKQRRAVLLMQCLVDASTRSPEYLLPLNKVLCGLCLSEPLDATLIPGELETTACRRLLRAVVANWQILKNTSIAGFQQAFLQREGILRPHHGAWLLQVEGASHDVVMDKLPWSIQVVKLPWMARILYVDWQRPP
jgi:hypothetical protein